MKYIGKLVDPCRRNDIAAKRRARESTRAVGSGGQGIENLALVDGASLRVGRDLRPQESTEIPLPHCGGWNRNDGSGGSRAITESIVRTEEEESVPNDPPPNDPAELILLFHVPFCRKNVAGIQTRVPHILESLSVVIVGARFHDQIHARPKIETGIGIGITRDTELRN